MADWQPIETAPKDGSSILATSEYGDMSVVYWKNGLHDWVGQCDGEDSIQSQGDTYTDLHRPYVTHWMPLPEAPKVAK